MPLTHPDPGDPAHARLDHRARVTSVPAGFEFVGSTRVSIASPGLQGITATNRHHALPGLAW